MGKLKSTLINCMECNEFYEAEMSLVHDDEGICYYCIYELTRIKNDKLLRLL